MTKEEHEAEKRKDFARRMECRKHRVRKAYAKAKEEMYHKLPNEFRGEAYANPDYY